MRLQVNYDIAVTHLVTRKKQTFVAALGVTIGMTAYLFLNSLSSGFTKSSRDAIFQSNAHIQVYKKDEISNPIVNNDSSLSVILNPQITTLTKTLVNPTKLLDEIRNEPYITNAIAQVDFSAFYNRGNTQLKGSGSGVNMIEYAQMFNTQKYMVGGSLEELQGNLNGIIIGNGIANKLNLGLGDNITVNSSYNVTKVLTIVGIFNMGNTALDDSKCFVNISTAQQFLKQSNNYVTTIFANTPNPDRSEDYVKKLQGITSYTVEDWKTTNADLISTDRIRKFMLTAISLTILIVSSFGIYNILSATISQKINDIAILKATGFKGKDVIKIFVSEALMMGTIGIIVGLFVGALLIKIMSGVYVGGPLGFFPIGFEWLQFVKSGSLGFLITLFAGYFPAKKAAGVDPVEIFRK